MNAQWVRFAQEIGIETCLTFDPKLLTPEQRIRGLCGEDKCGNYGHHHMCPPRIGSSEEAKSRIGMYQNGILLQYSKPLDVKNDREGLKQSKLDFHEKVLQLEGLLRSDGIEHPWGMIGGSCELCGVCRVDEPCPYPERTRTSLTALGIDVIALLAKCGLDSEFHPDRITWTGCVLL